MCRMAKRQTFLESTWEISLTSVNQCKEIEAMQGKISGLSDKLSSLESKLM